MTISVSLMIIFGFLLGESFIYICTQTEEGIEYLQNEKRLETTDIDKKALYVKFTKKILKK